MNSEDRSRIIGRLETLVALEGHTITLDRRMMILFEDCIDRLHLIDTQLLAEVVKRHEEASTEPWNTKDPYQ